MERKANQITSRISEIVRFNLRKYIHQRVISIVYSLKLIILMQSIRNEWSVRLWV